MYYIANSKRFYIVIIISPYAILHTLRIIVIYLHSTHGQLILCDVTLLLHLGKLMHLLLRSSFDSIFIRLQLLQAKCAFVRLCDGLCTHQDDHGVRGCPHVVCPEARPES